VFGVCINARSQITISVAGQVEENLATPQMSLKQGNRCFGEAGIQAVKKRITMKALQKSELTPEQQGQALAYLMFLKYK
jgi:hypothetical protein